MDQIRKKIVIVTVAYPPEIRSASDLMYELSIELTNRGHDVSVITLAPMYNLSEKSITDKVPPASVEEGVLVIRVKSYGWQKHSYLIRAVTEFFMPLQFIFAIVKNRLKADIVIVYSPPLPLSLVGLWLRLFGAKFILNLQDLFPQNAIDLGILKNNYQILFYRFFEWVCYKGASFITLHSHGNLSLMKEKFWTFDIKFKLIHNWVDVNHFQTRKSTTDFRKKWNIYQKYILVFAGVLGPSQFLSHIVRLAQEFCNRKDLLFLIVGDGKERSKLEYETARLGLSNLVVKDFISRSEYPSLLNICSVGLVCLSPDNTTPVVPGKILGYMAAGLPVAAFLHEKSDGHEIIRNANCGVSAMSSDINESARKLENLLNNEEDLAVLGKNGKNYVTKFYGKVHCVDELEVLFDT